MRRFLSLSAAFLSVASLVTTSPSFAESKPAKADPTEKMVGTLIKTYLSQYHYTGKNLDDSLSKNAFDEFVKKVDYGKQFLLQSDVKRLSLHGKKS